MTIGRLPVCGHIVVLFVLVLCAGCKTVRQAREAQSATDRLAGETTVTAREAGLEPSHVYALTNLEQIALLYHPSVLQARQAVESARIQIHSVRGGRLPTATASGSYGRNTENSWGYQYSDQMQGSWSGSVSLDLLLYDFGKLDAKEKKAVSELIAAERQLRQTQLDVTYAVQTAFFELLRGIELYRVAVESEHQYAEHLEEARTMAEVGTRRAYDVTKAEVDWGNARLEVITASNTVITAQAQLERNLGLAEQAHVALAAAEMPPCTLSADSLMAVARRDLPSLAVLDAKTRAASAAVDQAVADLYPDLKLGADSSLSGRGFPFAWNYSWAASLAQTLFTGFQKTDAIKDAVTQLRIARTVQADAEQSLYLEIIQAEAKRMSALKSLEVAEMVQRQSAENLAIVNEQYRVGLSSSIERTDAQVTLTKAQGDVVRDRYDYQNALAHLGYLAGVLHVPEPPPPATHAATPRSLP